MSAAEPTIPTLSPAKLWLFRFITVVVLPVLLLGGAELGLRVVGYGKSPRFLVPDAEPGFVRTNPDFSSFFLPGSFDLRPLNQRLRVQKPANALRVFVLGESAAQGIPSPAFGFVPQLRAQLRARYPDREVEVINAGIVAINSHVMYQVAQDAARYSPDLFVVYMGNNEVVGPYGPGCAYGNGVWPARLVRAATWLRATRLGQLVAATMARFASAARPQEWGGMAMFVDHAVRGDDPRLEGVYRNYERNLRDILRAAESAGAKTVLCTVVSNLADSAPFLSLHRPDLGDADRAKWQQALSAGRVAWRLGEIATARGQLEQALGLDPQYAETAFLLGKIAPQEGNTATARRYFLEAQYWDALRFRPAPRLNAIARELAASRPGVTLVDAAQALGSDLTATGPIAGRELLLEHVHLDWEGNRRLAALIAEGAERALGSAPTGNWLNSTEVAAAVGYTPAERLGLLQRTALITRQAPFPNQLTYAEDQARMARAQADASRARRDPSVLRAALATVQGALQRDPENTDLLRIQVELTDDLGDTAGALALVQRARRLQPDNFALATDEAIKLARMSRFDEAEKLLLTTFAGARATEQAKMTPAIADFYTRARRLADGRRWFDGALARDPHSIALRFYRGRLAQLAGDARAAEDDFRGVLTADPRNEPALDTLLAMLSAQARKADADELALHHEPFQPDNQANHLRVADILEARGDAAGTAAALEAAVRSGPVPLAVHLRLANQLNALQRRDELLEELAVAWKLSLDEDDREVTASLRELIARVRGS